MALSLFFDPLYKGYKDIRSNDTHNIRRSVAYDVDRLLNFYVEILLYIIKISQTRFCLFIYFEKQYQLESLF